MSTLGKIEKLKIEDVVSGLLHQFGYNDKIDDYVNIAKFLSDLGFNVGTSKLFDNEDGFIVIRSKTMARTDNLGDKVIAVNQNRSFEMKRFIIAYEFAISVLECKETEYFSHQRLVYYSNC